MSQEDSTLGVGKRKKKYVCKKSKKTAQINDSEDVAFKEDTSNASDITENAVCCAEEITTAIHKPPLVVGALSFDADSDLSNKTRVPESLPSLPDSLPFHFNLDVSCGKLNGNKSAIDVGTVIKSLENEWLRLRMDQERAWLLRRKPSYDAIRSCRIHGGDKTQLMKLPTQWFEHPELFELRWFGKQPLRVLRLLTLSGQMVTSEMLVSGKFNMGWITMQYDICSDPLVLDVNFNEGSQFQALLNLYESHLEFVDDGGTHELRIALVQIFDYALVFPALPYRSCRLKPPEDAIGRHFPPDLQTGKVPDDIAFFAAQATLATLFWDCFNTIFPDRSEVNYVEGCFASFFELKDCTVREDALQRLWEIMKPHLFQLPFYGEVSSHKIAEGLLPWQSRCRKYLVDKYGSTTQASRASLLNTSLERRANSVRYEQGHERVGLTHGASAAAIEEHMPSKELSELLCAVETIFHEAAVKAKANGSESIPQAWLSSSATPDDPNWPLEIYPLDGVAKGLEGSLHRIEPLVQLGREVSLATLSCLAVLRCKQKQEDCFLQSSDLAGQVEEIESRQISLTVDLANWEKSGTVILMDLNTNDHLETNEVIRVVEQLEYRLNSQSDLLVKFSQLAYGLRAYQRAYIKRGMREVGLTVFEVRREVEHPHVSGDTKIKEQVPSTRECGSRFQLFQRIMLISAPEQVLRLRAEQYGLQAKVLPSRKTDAYLGGFVRSQFELGAPFKKFWVENPRRPYPYLPYFSPRAPWLNPGTLLSAAERKWLVKTFITDPVSELHFPDGTIDPRQGGLNMDPRGLVAANIIAEVGLLPLISPGVLRRLLDCWALPWRKSGLGKFVRVLVRKHFGLDEVLHVFGPRVMSYFAFQDLLVRWLAIPATLGVIAQCVGAPLMGEGSHLKWQNVVQPLFGIFISLWGVCFCIRWRRFVLFAAYKWQNGFTKLGAELSTRNPFEYSRVRPEYALMWRQNFLATRGWLQRRYLGSLRKVLRVPRKNFPTFTDLALTNDIGRFDDTCYTSKSTSYINFFLSASFDLVFILLACLATVGSRALQDALAFRQAGDVTQQKNTTYFISGITSGIVLPVINYTHRKAAPALVEWLNYRGDQQLEAALFRKLFIFAFLNTYNNLFYIAIIDQDMFKLRGQVAGMLVSMTAVRTLSSLVWFYIWKGSSAISALFLCEDQTSGNFKKVRTLGKVFKATELGFHSCAGMEKLVNLGAVLDALDRTDEFLIVHEVLELVMQYGLILLFSCALPIAPAVMMLFGIFEARFDAFLLLAMKRCPEPRMVVGIGKAFDFFFTITCISIFVNVAFLFFPKYEMSGAVGSARDDSGASALEILMPQSSSESRIILILAIEHIMLVFVYLAARGTPISDQVDDEQYRQKYFENREAFAIRQTTQSAAKSKQVQNRQRRSTSDAPNL